MFIMEWMTIAISGLNVDVAAMKNSAQSLPCFGTASALHHWQDDG